MVLVIESKYLRIIHEKFKRESRESYEMAIRMLERENVEWNKDYIVKDVISEFKRVSEINYEDFVKEYLKKIYDKNMRLKEKYGDVVINEELIDMVDDHNRWLNYRLLYGKRIKDIIKDNYMEVDLVDKLLEVLEGGKNE